MADVRGEGWSLIRTRGRGGSENPSFGRTSFVNGPLQTQFSINFTPNFFHSFQPTLPSTAMCKICEENLADDDETLMECASCGKIVHPTCVSAKGYFYVVPDLNNCWKCPDCCDKHLVCIKMSSYARSNRL